MTPQWMIDIEPLQGIEKLLAVIAQLRNPEGGCPWDLKQTHASLKPYLLEESYEVLDAIDQAEPDALKEELGDVLLQVALHAQLAKDAQQFDFEQVAEGIAQKLIRRHPHVFGDVIVANSEEVTRNWQAIKKQEKGNQSDTESILAGVSYALPALSRALTVSKRAVKVGFEWPNVDSLWACFLSELEEFKAEINQNAPFGNLEDEMGDILFAAVNLARHYNIDPEVALSRATTKFTQRFQTMEKQAIKPLETLSFEEWDLLWNQAKKETLA